MEEQILAASRVDEAEAPVRQPFDGSLCHWSVSRSALLELAPPDLQWPAGRRLID